MDKSNKIMADFMALPLHDKFVFISGVISIYNECDDEKKKTYLLLAKQCNIICSHELTLMHNKDYCDSKENEKKHPKT